MDDRQHFDQLMRDWSAAIVANDPEAIGRFAEPDWILIGEGGIFPRDQFLESVAAGVITHDSMSHEIHEVRVHADSAIVITRGHNTGTFNGTAFRQDEWTTEIFIRREDGWKCSVTHLTAAANATPTTER